MNLSFNTASPLLIAECKDTSEKIDLFEKYGLYIKPIARLNITIQLPPTKLPGQTVSSSEIIDKVKKLISPEEFIYLRIIKSTLEFIRCEGEIENKSSFKTILSKLDGSTIKMNAYTDVLKIRAAETKISYPTRHDWETFFKDSSTETTSNIELKPGERPDTIHLCDLPCKWFSVDRIKPIDINNQMYKPSEQIVKEVFAFFGELRQIDIPMLTNPIIVSQNLAKKQSLITTELINTNSNLNLNTFELFVQYKDYISFVKAMDAFRGMKLLYIDQINNENYTANIRVDFDRTRHLSDKEIKKREIDKLKAIELEKIKNAQLEKEKDKEAKQKEIATYRLLLESADDSKKSSNLEEKSKEQRRREREEARRQKRFAKKQQEEEKKLEMKIALEERKILIAQRKLESMRLLEELFNRVKVIVAQEELEKREKEMKEAKIKRKQEQANEEIIKKRKQEQEELELKEKVERNLAMQAAKSEELEKKAQLEQQEHFELRKDTLVEDVGGDSQITTTQVKQEKLDGNSINQQPVQMPRVVLLSNAQLQQQQSQLSLQKPKLYDEDDIAIKDSPSKLDDKEMNVIDDTESSVIEQQNIKTNDKNEPEYDEQNNADQKQMAIDEQIADNSSSSGEILSTSGASNDNQANNPDDPEDDGEIIG